MTKRYTHISREEEERIREDAAYGGIKDGGESVLRQIQREREQGGTDEQVLHEAKRDPVVREALRQEEQRLRHNYQMAGHHNTESLARKELVDRIAGRK
jgi:hypothetical protein